MSDHPPAQPPGWYPAQGDPPGTHRYWDGSAWQGGPQPIGSTAGPIGVAADARSNLASPGLRLVARLADLVWWIIVSFIIAAVIGGGSAVWGTEASARQWLASAVSTVAIVALEIVFLTKKGATPGKMMVGIQVADVATRTSPIDTRSAVLRMVPMAIGIVPFIGGFISLIIGVVSVILIFTDRQRQAVWDKLAGTVVVRGR